MGRRHPKTNTNAHFQGCGSCIEEVVGGKESQCPKGEHLRIMIGLLTPCVEIELKESS